MQDILCLNVGDWSNDGHGVNKQVLITSNKTVAEIQEAYKASCKLTGVAFNHSENYTGKAYKYGSPYLICTEYEEPSITEEAKEILNSFGLNIIEDRLDKDSFSNLWFDFIKLSLPDFEYNYVKISNINGFWDKNLNCQFGYGLFD